MSSHLRGLLERTFGGWVQTRVNEKGNKVLRDAQARDNASKASSICSVRYVAGMVMLSYHTRWGDKGTYNE